MAVTLNLPPATEAALRSQAEKRGLTIEAWLADLARHAAEEAPRASGQFENLSDLLLNSPFAGANLELDRCGDHPRPVEIE